MTTNLTVLLLAASDSIGNATATDAWGRIANGFAFYMQGKYDEAIKAFDKAIELDPKNVDARNGKGVALQKLDRNDEAIKGYDKGNRVRSTICGCLGHKGNVPTDQGNTMKLFRRMISRSS